MFKRNKDMISIGVTRCLLKYRLLQPLPFCKATLFLAIQQMNP